MTAALALTTACLLLGAVDSPPAVADYELPPEGLPQMDVVKGTNDDPYSGVYTKDELTALDNALWAGNMTRADLSFLKDYAKGYECFPIVREMMADPLRIGEVMERMNARAQQGNLLDQHSFLPFISESLPAPSRNVERDLVREAQLFSELPRGLTQRQVGLFKDLFKAFSEKNFFAPKECFTPEFRDWLPTAMAWHPVDTTGTPAEENASSLNKQNFGLISELDVTAAYVSHSVLLQDYYFMLDQDTKGLFPTDQPLVVNTSAGRICIGTMRDDTYTGDFAVLIDPGGNDHYVNCRIGAAYGKRSNGSAGVTPASGQRRDAAATESGDKNVAATEYSPLGDGRVAFFADLGGDDVYDCGDVDITLGAAVLGVAAFYDLGAGNDRYYGGNFSLGAAAGGIATFYDDGGSDYYSSKVYSQGAAGFGIAIMCDDSVQDAPVVPTDVETPDPINLAAFDNDTYEAWSEAQGFARTRGIAICANKRGNETYKAGGVYLHAPLFADRYQSFSQGFAIGERDIDYAGGIALLADYSGNDRYLGDIYNQGVGYWYSAGFIYDKAGNDLYEMTQYGQGSGIHLAIGGLMDDAGSDTYIMNNGLGQGGSHDFAASLFLDKAGNDRYLGNTSCNGCGLTNSVGLFIDRSGDDVYAGKRGSLNVGRPARGFGSIGLLLDMAGKDDYLGAMNDDLLWTKSTTGMGLDLGPLTLEALWPGRAAELAAAADPLAANNAGFDKPSEGLKMPEEVSYQGALNQEIFDKLWEIAIRWEVGDNRVIVPEARKRLIAFGPEVLPYIEQKMDDPNSLAIRGYVDVFRAFAYEPLPAAPAGTTPDPNANPAEPKPLPSLPLVQELLRRQLASSEVQRQQSALSTLAEVKLPDMGAAVAGLLDNPDILMQRRAIGTLGMLRDPVANARLAGFLSLDANEALCKVSVEALCGMQAPVYEQLRALLAHPAITVRETVENQLTAQWETYGAQLQADYLNPAGLGTQAQRCLLRVLLAAKKTPDAAQCEGLWRYFNAEDWGLRSDALALADSWNQLTVDNEALNIYFSGMTGLSREESGMREQNPGRYPRRLEEAE